MNLQNLTRETFAPGGLLSRTVEEFRPREGQTDMAVAVARTIEDGGVLVVEAGTGIGKTFAYLVPALLSGTQVLLSTATKALQDQLFGRDLPRLMKALGLPVRTALLKGRGSYLCLHRLAVARRDASPTDRVMARTLAKIETWAQLTRTGDLAELPGLDERSPVIALVTSSRDNCLGSQCPKFRGCHVNQARREALTADVVVVNHHLFFADLAIRESGMAELLPSVQTVIFDEAHQLNETGVQFLGRQLTTGQLLDFGRDLLLHGLQHARGLQDWQTLAFDTEHAARDLRLVVGQSSPGAKLRWVGVAPDLVDEFAWQDALAGLQAVCDRVVRALDTVSAIAPDLIRLSERAGVFIEKLAFFSDGCASDSVRWLDVGVQLSLVESPLDIADTVQTRLIKSKAEDALRRAWIFTSATLGADAQLSWFTEPCGLLDSEILKIGSPFNYAEQAALYVPRHFPKPSESGHSAQVADFVARSASVIGGRTLVLTTTLRALQSVSAALQRHFAESGSLAILVQGQQPKRELMQRFRQGDQGGGPGCILVASASFWEGVDVPGDALQMVVIDKLPFAPPADPLVQARSRQLLAAGRSVFKDYALPEAAMALKQGAGRLIRRESDRGILVVCDTRLTLMGYGKKLLSVLPLMRQISSEEELAEVLAALGSPTRPSTKDPCWL
ncbi:MAG: ATP-dependent DNA helicase [Gammaproteobacteria bacterium]|uniref:ATP-dependent DNA helicase n=1 Tax=Rhodoferax sp. TaxID=50421 RepID=UPI001826DF3D|nr:ATP-dependent DNA helicase [Rhodoferax sp.]MBU3899588.1 ATP-dependent DNA helicase [Gammaproteobacteria bacterium]MBA3056612.1 ATP-dependent DNA helicase [Rhodoferax sp.]MBU3998919.1 ATP-dependent DNA helicase [Gammaproteobacteria bacterium]MBU4018064.1 ATP-dependent DNA helicase [Gammaproteobacteria bacterium]MBU4080245.1 ATP-dependent DNA helicase [Gammaproteobacteria bacterium]